MKTWLVLFAIGLSHAQILAQEKVETALRSSTLVQAFLRNPSAPGLRSSLYLEDLRAIGTLTAIESAVAELMLTAGSDDDRLATLVDVLAYSDAREAHLLVCRLFRDEPDTSIVERALRYSLSRGEVVTVARIYSECTSETISGAAARWFDDWIIRSWDSASGVKLVERWWLINRGESLLGPTLEVDPLFGALRISTQQRLIAHLELIGLKPREE